MSDDQSLSTVQVYNDCVFVCSVTEEQCLSQIHQDELFGAQDWNPVAKKAEEDKKK